MVLINQTIHMSKSQALKGPVIPKFFFFCVDKMCDQISDAVLDAYLSQDPDSKVACGKSTSYSLTWQMHVDVFKTFI